MQIPSNTDSVFPTHPAVDQWINTIMFLHFRDILTPIYFNSLNLKSRAGPHVQSWKSGVRFLTTSKISPWHRYCILYCLCNCTCYNILLFYFFLKKDVAGNSYCMFKSDFISTLCITYLFLSLFWTIL